MYAKGDVTCNKNTENIKLKRKLKKHRSSTGCGEKIIIMGKERRKIEQTHPLRAL
jgi:hypothetical protein